MNHLESSFTGKNGFWRYIVMFAAVLLASNTIGAIPIFIAYAIRAAADPGVVTDIANNPGNLGVLGLNPNLGFLVMLFPFLIGLLTFVLLIKPLNGRTFIMTINGTGKIRWKKLFISASIWLLLSAIYFIAYLKADPSNFSIANTATSTILILAVLTIVFIPFQATFEEVLFRGYLMQGFTVISKNRWFPILMTSILFGLMHSFNPEVKDFGFLPMMAQYVLFGITFGIITILDDGIEATIGAHAANNVFLCIVVTNSSSALQTPAVYVQQSVHPWIEFTALLVTGIIFVFILKSVFKWKDFSALFSEVKPVREVAQVP